MNQSGRYRADLGGIVCDSVTPYQKVADHFRQREFKDRTVLLHERRPMPGKRTSPRSKARAD